MPNSPEGISAILEQLNRFSSDLGRYATALELNTQAVSDLRVELQEVRERLNQDEIIQAKREGREEAERELRRKRNNNTTSDDDSGTHNRDMIVSGQRVKAQGGIVANLSPRELILVLVVLAAIATGNWSWVIRWFK